MKKDKSAAAKAAKLSEGELLRQTAQHEKREDNLKFFGIIGTVIGVIGTIISMALEIGLLGLIFTVVVIVSVVSYFLGIRTRKETEALIDTQLDDFFESELERAFGPRADTSKMPINLSFLDQLHPVEKHWDRCRVWRFYEGNYHGTHFSAADAELYYLDTDYRSNENTRQTVFNGFVLRCKDVCDPALDIVLRRDGADLSARTGNDQPADDLVTPQLRELIRKIVSFSGKYTVNSLIFRSGEVVMAIGGYSFGHGLPSGSESLQDFDMIRRRFTDSLYPVCKLIEGLQDSGGDV